MLKLVSLCMRDCDDPLTLRMVITKVKVTLWLWEISGDMDYCKNYE